MAIELKGTYVDPREVREYDYYKDLYPKHRTQNGSLLTTALVYESTSNDKTNAIFTLKDSDYITQDGQYLFSLPRLYLLISDPSEYKFADVVFGGWTGWSAMAEAPWIQKTLERIRETLEIKIKSQAIMQIQDKSSAGGKDSMAASKFLAEKGYDKRKAGRPTKSEVERQKRIASGVKSELDEDYERMTGESY